MVHSGSWLGLPDFGITEKLGDLVGVSRTPQGGSNLSGSVDYAAQRIAGLPSYNSQASSGQVQGLSTMNYTPANASYGSPTPSSSGGSSGGSGGGGVDLSNPVKKTEYANSQGYDTWDLYQDAMNAARGSSDAELSSLNTEFDKNKALAEQQLGYLSRTRENSLAELGNQKDYLLSQIGSQKEKTIADRDKNIDSAAQSARKTQASNRNMLRALGILNSTAAGDILSRPTNQFDKVKAEYVQMAQQRTSELDDYLNAKTSELALATKSLEEQYGNMVNQIQTDLRFSDRERADAIRAANAALSERMSEIKMAQANFVNEVNAQKANIAMQLSQYGNYQMPGFDPQTILSQVFNPGTDSYNPQQVGIYNDKDRLSTL